MIKVTDQMRRQCDEALKIYQVRTGEFLKREAAALAVIAKNEEDTVPLRLALVEDMLNLASYFIVMGKISQALLEVRDEDALNNGRKALYKGVMYLESLVSNFVDAPFSDYEKKVAVLETMSEEKRYLLVRKMGLAIQLLEDAYGDNSKWRWSFVELDGRYAATAKNILDMKAMTANMDPRSPDHDVTFFHVRLIKKLLLQSADQYRQKYELSSRESGDINRGIQFLQALRRLHVLLEERDEAEELKKQADVWTNKMKQDSLKRKEELQKK
ncbi:hypothetical protein AGMMS49991_07400 [Spirochaetia bacterium]|nr:hypothetical protein AGMMS49991_07400 [Spirochaetia bacterium]